MGYKKYHDIEMAKEMIDKITRREISNRGTAHGELTIIMSEWRGTTVAEDAEKVDDEKYSDLQSKNYF